MTTPSATDPGRAWVDVDLDALRANARTVADRSGRPLMPMVKANAYGLGAVAVSRALEELDPWGYGVAAASEAAELRAAGIARPIVVFTPLLAIDSVREMAGVRPVIGDLAALDAWLAGGDAPFHLEIDTGMSRGGIRWDQADQLERVARRLDRAVGFEGVFTHFHSADSDFDATVLQWRRFETALKGLPRPPLIHAASSAAALLGPRFAGDLVRPGIFLYGGAAGAEPDPRPVAALRAPVVGVRTVAPGDSVSYGATWRADRATTVATVAVGYADGVPRSLSGVGRIELHGRLCPIAGRVTMDMTMIAVADGAVRTGDIATVYGGMIPLEVQAAAAGTVSYELLTGIGSRVSRRYWRGG